MKKFFSKSSLLAFLVTLTLRSYGQSSLSGVVTDSLTHEPLVGANVFLVGTSIGSSADINGKYRIASIPEGSYNLRISCIGYATKNSEMAVKAGAEITFSVELQPQAIEGEEVIVTAQMRGQVAAINQQIASQTMVNVVSADRIRELPDNNAAESVGRLPGISLLRNAGEASQVVIRGMEPKMNAVTVNGVKIPATSQNSTVRSSDDARRAEAVPGDRSVDLSMIASETLEGIEVFKASTPDMDAENVGGVVNLKIKKAPEEQKVKLKLGPGYNQLASSFGDYKFSGEYSDRFFESAVGVMATGNYEQLNRNSENFGGTYRVLGTADSVTGITPVGGNTMSIQNIVERRKRLGAGLTVDYAFHEGTIWLTSFYSSTSRDPFEINKQFDPMAQDKIIYNLRDQEITLNGFSNSFNGELSLGGLNMDWVVSSYRIVNDRSKDFTMTLWQNNPFDQAIFVPNQLATFYPAAKDDLTKIYLRDNYDEPNKLVQTDYTGQYNLKMPFTLWTFLSGYLKAGAKYAETNRDNKSEGYGQGQYYINTFVAGAQPYYDKPIILNPDGLISSLNFISSPGDRASIVNKKYSLFPLFDREILKSWNEQQRGYYQFDRNTLAGSYTLKEELTAGYLMTQLKLGTVLTLVTGARFEHENNRYTSVWTSATEVYGRAGTQKDSSTTRRSDDWFPNLHARVQVLEGLDFRFSVNKTIARPDYYWISPWTRLVTTNAIIYRGNPLLKDTKIWNYNVSAYLYNNWSGFFSVSGFYKDLRDIFYAKQSQVLKTEDIIALDLPGREGGYQMNAYANSEKAEVKGIEVEWQTQLAFYPGMPQFLRGIVLNLNYSRIWSKTYFPYYNVTAVRIPNSRPPRYTYLYDEGEREGSMPGQADQIANISFGYDTGDLSARVSLSYQGKSLSILGTSREADRWNVAFYRWDFLARYRFTQWMSLSVNVVNISNQPDQEFLGKDIYPTDETYYGTTGSASLEITL